MWSGSVAHSAPTNTVNVTLPPGGNLHAMTAAFRKFGDIRSLELLPGDSLTAAVVFFDVRSAMIALEAMAPGFAAPAQQTGSRWSLVPGDISFEAEYVTGISNIVCDSRSKDGSYYVEFFDTRQAAKAQALAGPPGLTAEFPKLAPVTEVDEEDSGGCTQEDLVSSKSKQVPVYVTPSVDVTSSLSSSLLGCTVLIHGMPNKLLTEDCMEAILQQAGLDEDVSEIKISKGSPCGEVFLTFGNADAAELCISHFNGRHWDSSGAAVNAALVVVGQEADDKWLTCRLRSDSAITEVSTEAGPSSEGDDDQEGDDLTG